MRKQCSSLERMAFFSLRKENISTVVIMQMLKLKYCHFHYQKKEPKYANFNKIPGIHLFMHRFPVWEQEEKLFCQSGKLPL